MDLARLIPPLTLFGLVGVMLTMGFSVTLSEVIAANRSFTRVAMALLANFVVVPAATLVLLAIFNPPPMVSVGFIILAVCPGAPLGPPFTAAARGDVASATGQMIVLAGLSAVLSPLLLNLLTARLLPTSDLQVDTLAIARTLLLSQILPLAIGLGINHRLPRLARRLQGPLGLLSNLVLLLVVVLLMVRESEMLAAIRLRGWLGMSLLLVASLTTGWLCGAPTQSTRKALAVTTSVRNAAVGLVIVSTNFAGTPAVTAVIAYALLSILATRVAAVLLARVPEAAPA